MIYCVRLGQNIMNNNKVILNPYDLWGLLFNTLVQDIFKGTNYEHKNRTIR